MTREQETLLMVRGVISELTDEQKKTVSHCENVIRNLLTQYPNGEAILAYTLIGAEMSAQ